MPPKMPGKPLVEMAERDACLTSPGEPGGDRYQTFNWVQSVSFGMTAILSRRPKEVAKPLRVVQLQRSSGDRSLSAPCTLKLEGAVLSVSSS